MGWGQPKIHKPFFAKNIVLRRGSPLLCRCFGQEIAWSLWEWEWEWYALHSRPLVSVQYTFLYFSFCKEYILKACCARCWELVGWGWVLQGRRLSALLPKYLPAVVIVHICRIQASVALQKNVFNLPEWTWGPPWHCQAPLGHPSCWQLAESLLSTLPYVLPTPCNGISITQWKKALVQKSWYIYIYRYIQTITLSRTPPTGSTRPCNDISPVIAWMIDKGNGLRFWVI